eukprot:scaffold57995_cov28-Tisochrysis_lutea.AAC.4
MLHTARLTFIGESGILMSQSRNESAGCSSDEKTSCEVPSSMPSPLSCQWTTWRNGCEVRAPVPPVAALSAAIEPAPGSTPWRWPRVLLLGAVDVGAAANCDGSPFCGSQYVQRVSTWPSAVPALTRPSSTASAPPVLARVACGEKAVSSTAPHTSDASAAASPSLPRAPSVPGARSGCVQNVQRVSFNSARPSDRPRIVCSSCFPASARRVHLAVVDNGLGGAEPALTVREAGSIALAPFATTLAQVLLGPSRATACAAAAPSRSELDSTGARADVCRPGGRRATRPLAAASETEWCRKLV